MHNYIDFGFIYLKEACKKITDKEKYIDIDKYEPSDLEKKTKICCTNIFE